MWRLNLAILRFNPVSGATSARRTLFVSTRNSQQTVTGSAQAEQPTISKDALMRMRKQTDYSYVKCRKALAACVVEQNYDQAMRWLKETAAKLGTRVVTQGLCGVLSQGNVCVFVELNCETDFVACNTDFKNLVGELTTALASHASNVMPVVAARTADRLSTINVGPSEFRVNDGRTAEEAIVAAVGKIGENIRLGRAAVMFAQPSAQLIGQTHPKEDMHGVQVGRFVSLVALEAKQDRGSDLPLTQLGQHLCQHIIGMVPSSLGTPASAPGKETGKHPGRRPEEDANQQKKTEPEPKVELTEQQQLEEELNASQVDHSKIFRHPTNNMFNMTGILQLASAMQMIPYRKYSTNAASTEQVEVKKKITIAELVKISSYQTILPFFLTIMLTLLGFFFTILGFYFKIGSKIDALKERMDDKMGGMEKRIDDKMKSMEKRIDDKMKSMEKRIDDKMGGMEKRIDDKMGGMEKRIDGIEKRMGGVEGKLTEIDKKMESFCASAMHVPSEKKKT